MAVSDGSGVLNKKVRGAPSTAATTVENNNQIEDGRAGAVEEDSIEEDSGDEDEESTCVYEDYGALEIPQSVLAQILAPREHLRKLSLKGNRLRTLPAVLASLRSLYYLNLSHNEFSSLPEVICELPGLEILDVSYNHLTQLPNKLAQLPNLLGLSLVGNRFEVLPPVLADLQKLEFLELENNPIRAPSHVPLAENYPDVESWLATIRELIRVNRPALLSALANQQRAPSKLQVERSRSASESSVGRNAKRMGFVMSRNATDKSYVESLHARGMSHDSHLLEYANAGNNAHGNTSQGSILQGGVLQGGVLQSGIASSGSTTTAPVASAIPSSASSIASTIPSNAPSPDVSPRQAPPDDTKRLHTLLERDADESLDTEIDSSPVYARRASRDASITPVTPNTSVHNVGAPHSEQETLVPELEFALKELLRTVEGLAPSLPPAVGTALAETQGALNAVLAGRGPLGAVLTNTSLLIDRLLANNSHLNRRQQRQLVACVMLTFPELEAAWQRTCAPITGYSTSGPGGLSAPTAPATPGAMLTPLAVNVAQPQAQDDQLHAQLDIATRQAQGVLALLNQVIARSASAAANASGNTPGGAAMALRVRDLSAVCLRCNNSVRGVRQLLEQLAAVHTRTRQLSERRRFFDMVQGFLRAVLATLAAVKSSLPDVPLLADSRVSTEVADLTRTVKEIPPLLEQSSYWLLLQSGQAEDPQLQTMFHVPPHMQSHAGNAMHGNAPNASAAGSLTTMNSFSTIQSASSSSNLGNMSLARAASTASIHNSTAPLPPPTPLTATLGPAAQALVSPNERGERFNEGYIHERM